MAETVKINKTGNTPLDGIELENFATEATLSAILDQLKSVSSGVKTTVDDGKKTEEKAAARHSKVLAAILGGGAAGEVNAAKVTDVVQKMFGPALDMFKPLSGLFSNIESLTPEFILLFAGFKLVTGAIHMFQAALNLVSRTISSVFSVAGNLVGTLLQGKIGMGDFVQAVARGTESIPIVGKFTALLAAGASALEGWNQTLYSLTAMGANFGGGISEMITSAAESGLTLEQFTSVIKENTAAFASFGSVTKGIDTYQKVAKISLQEYSGTLADLNISFAQYSEELPRILGLFGAAAKAHGATDRDLAKSAVELITQFDAMSQLTGKTREQQASDLAKLTEDAAWQRELTKMTGDQAAKYTQALNEIQQTSGTAYAELYKLTVLGMPPLTKELQTLLATTPGLRTEFEKMTAIVKGGSTGLERGKQLDSVAADMVEMGLRTGQTFDVLVKAATAGMSGTVSEIAAVQKDLLANTKEFIQNGHLNRAEFEKQLNENRIRLAKDKEISDNLTKFSNLMTVLRTKIYTEVIGPLVEKLGPAITIISDAFAAKQGPLQNLINYIVSLVNDMGTWLSKHKKDLQRYVEQFIGVIKSIITFTVFVVKIIAGITEYVLQYWDQIKWILLVVGAAIVILAGLVGTAGLIFVVSMMIKALTMMTGAFETASAAMGEQGIMRILGRAAGGGVRSILGLGAAEEAAAVGGTAAVGEATAVGGGIAGLAGGEAAGLGGIAAVAGGEAATGIGIPLALATLAVGGLGYMAWKHFADEREKEKREQEKGFGKSSTTENNQSDDLPTLMKKSIEMQEQMHRQLQGIYEAPSRSAKFDQ